MKAVSTFVESLGHVRISSLISSLITALATAGVLAVQTGCADNATSSPTSASDLAALSSKGGGGGGGGTTTPTPPAVPTITVTGISIVPSTVVAGATATATVLLSGPAPTGGTTVGVMSNNTAAATVQIPVVVAAGATSGTFTITSHPVAATSFAAISANAGGVTQTAVVAVVPVGVVASSLTLASTTLAGGATTTATVTLSASARAGGATVALASADPTRATVPAAVQVAAGATTATFAVNAQNVANPGAVQLTATFGGVTQFASLVVTPPAPTGAAVTALTVSPITIVGGTAAQGTVTIASAVATNTTVTLTSTAPAIASVPPSVIVPAGATSATFVVSTSVNNNGEGQFAEISASAGGSTRFADITTIPAPNGPFIASVTLVPSRIGGGGPLTGIVTLRSVATQGAVVTVTSSNPGVVQVPSEVVINANTSSAAFPVTTSRVGANVTVTITASGSGSAQGSASGTLVVTTDPPPPPDVVTVQSAVFQFVGGRGGNLIVKARSSSANAILTMFPDGSTQSNRVLANKGGGNYEGVFPTEIVPATVTVRSNLGGSATRAVQR
ncbi:MAG TPA: hypothetical protein VGM50_22515 [Gemmatimonadaceae bacterium]